MLASEFHRAQNRLLWKRDYNMWHSRWAASGAWSEMLCESGVSAQRLSQQPAAIKTRISDKCYSTCFALWAKMRPSYWTTSLFTFKRSTVIPTIKIVMKTNFVFHKMWNILFYTLYIYIANSKNSRHKVEVFRNLQKRDYSICCLLTLHVSLPCCLCLWHCPLPLCLFLGGVQPDALSLPVSKSLGPLHHLQAIADIWKKDNENKDLLHISFASVGP